MGNHNSPSDNNSSLILHNITNNTHKDNETLSFHSLSSIVYLELELYPNTNTNTTSTSTKPSPPLLTKQSHIKSNRTTISEESALSEKNTDIGDTELSTDPKDQTQHQIKHPLTIIWNGKCNSNVYITGSFCKWNQQFQLTYNEHTHHYEYTAYLPQGTYQFKFIVDNTWQCSNAYPVTVDSNNNVNNYIEHSTSNDIDDDLSSDIGESSNKDTSDSSIKPITNNKCKCKLTHNKQSKVNKTHLPYANVFPQCSELKPKCPCVPHELKTQLSFVEYNYIQPVGSKLKYLSTLEKNILNENHSFKQIHQPPHVVVNHLFTCNKPSSYVCLCSHLRIRNKHTTFIFCNPIQRK